MDISIITAVAPDRSDYLAEAEESIQGLREYVAAEWIVVWDGEMNLETPSASTVIEGRLGSGISCTRNLAIPLISAPVVGVLDADDKLVPSGVLEGLRNLSAEPEIGWIALSRTLIDGTPTVHSIEGEQIFQTGELAECWRAPFIFHPNSVLFKTSLLKLIGGWPAIVCNEDLGMVLQASELCSGKTLPNVLTRYRVWSKQEVSKPSYARNKELAFAVISSTINAMRQHCGRAPINPPANVGGAYGILGSTELK